jgi:acetate kinase
VCFDTAFYRTLPRLAQLYPIPHGLIDAGVVRDSLHYLSYEYIASVLPHHAGERAFGCAVVAHLGHGASLCGTLNRQSAATTIDFTALDGLIMGIRCAAVDYARSGLLGASGISHDVRVLLRQAAPRIFACSD